MLTFDILPVFYGKLRVKRYQPIFVREVHCKNA